MTLIIACEIKSENIYKKITTNNEVDDLMMKKNLQNEHGRMLKDKFGRIHNYLRISLTDRCNLRCLYCMPLQHCRFIDQTSLMTPKEIFKLAEIFVKSGVEKIRLTGGEPLLRKDFAEILEKLSKLPAQISITTNGVLVDNYFKNLLDAKVKTVNVSLDSLRPEKYNQITLKHVFHRVRNNILLLLSQGFKVKINVVVMKDVNENELLDFVEWTRELPLNVRFIEFMPFSGNKWQRKKVVTFNEILNKIAAFYPIRKLKDEQNSTSMNYSVEGFAGSFGIIATVSNPFCNSCNRLRVSAEGKLAGCLFSRKETNLLSPLRRDEELLPLIQQTLLEKAYQRDGLPHFQQTESLSPGLTTRSMVGIGG